MHDASTVPSSKRFATVGRRCSRSIASIEPKRGLFLGLRLMLERVKGIEPSS